ILQGDALPTNIFTRSGYTFQGWYDAPDGGTKVETVTEPQTLYARWEAVPEPEPTVYYTVTLPFVEGAATDPVAGDYDVESWSTFRFYLTIDKAYSQSQPVVTTSRGETLTPRTSDGAYLLKYVRTDVEIYIDGIEKNNPVANEPIRAAAPEPEIWSEDACLCIRLPEGLPTSPVRIFTPEGR
ncbi:InlB B-repeat-containing protein, partial [Parabacteroides goldsteinii]